MNEGERLAETSAMASEWPCQWDREIKTCYVEAFLAGWKARGENDADIIWSERRWKEMPKGHKGTPYDWELAIISQIRELDAPDSGGGA